MYIYIYIYTYIHIYIYAQKNMFCCLKHWSRTSGGGTAGVFIKPAQPPRQRAILQNHMTR